LEEGVFESKEFEYGKAELLIDSKKIMLIGYGNGVGKAYKVYQILKENGVDCGLLDLRFVKPFDKELLKSIKAGSWYVISDNAKEGGIGEMLESFVIEEGLNVTVESFEYPDKFIPHGSVEEVEKLLKTDVKSIAEKIREKHG
jgi:1-deoxy-D-xylulose-5-phosphate synthase